MQTGSGARPYPPAPWHIVGPAAVTMQLLDVAVARRFVPDDLAIVAVRPGRTLAALAITQYRTGSTLTYSELSVMPALVRCRRSIGSWISHMWVDDETSLRGGRQLWGMPKQMATFAWRWGPKVAVDVSAEGRHLASFGWRHPARLLPLPGLLASIGSVDGDRRRFLGAGVSRMAPATVRVEFPDDSPFAPLGLTRPARALAGQISVTFGRVKVLTPA